MILDPKRVNKGPKTIHCVFIGYAYNNSAYSFIVHKPSIKNIHNNIILQIYISMEGNTKKNIHLRE
jgi:hypothetical protein